MCLSVSSPYPLYNVHSPYLADLRVSYQDDSPTSFPPFPPLPPSHPTQGYDSPTHDKIEDTHATYDGCVEKCLQAMARGEKVEVLIASHNQVSKPSLPPSLPLLSQTSSPPALFSLPLF